MPSALRETTSAPSTAEETDTSGPMAAQEALLLLPHRRYNQAQLVAVTGKRGSGKTWLVQHWIQRQEPRILILDPFDKDFPGTRRRLDYQVALQELRQTADEGAERGDRFVPLRRRVVPDWGYLDPSAKFSGNCRDYAERFMEALIAACPPGEAPLNILLVLDELSLYVGRQIRGTAFETLVLQGRRMGIRTIVVTQRTNRFPIEMRSEVTEFVAFNASLRQDLEVYEEFGVPEGAQYLKRGECFYVPMGM